MSLFRLVDFLLAMEPRYLNAVCSLHQNLHPARRQNKRRNRGPPIRYETDVAHGGKAQAQEMQHVHEVQSSLQVPFHGAASTEKTQRESAQVGLTQFKARSALKETFLDRSAFDTRLRAAPADVVRTFGLARLELKRKQAKRGQENRKSGVQ